MEAYQSSCSVEPMSKLCKTCSAIFIPNAYSLYDPHCQNSGTAIWNPFEISNTEEVTWHPLHQSRRCYEQGLASDCELCNYITAIAPAGPICFNTSFVLTHRRLWVVVSSDSDGPLSLRKSLEFDIRPFNALLERRVHGIMAVQRAAISANKSIHTGSSEVLRLASSWLEQCTTYHQQCVRIVQPSWYPTRLLEMTGPIVRLILTVEHQMHGPYFTLSHCWGSQRPRLLLTRDTVGMLKDSLPIDSLEPTYRDALDATRSLGCRYLWIDLFCIFQGADDFSKQDWMKESVLMDRIYAGGALNISATHGHNGNAGCYSQRMEKPPLPPIIVSWLRYSGPHMQPIYCELRAPAHVPYSIEAYGQSPVFSRGWIVQERILAPRVLHFARGEIVWECAEGEATESFPNTEEGQAMMPGQLSSLHLSTKSRSTILWLWRCAISRYTQTTLTVPNKDKMAAVQGISQRIAESLNNTLFFGFLACTLPQSLCWYVEDGARRHKLPDQAENDSFPSWHFARSNEGISLPRFDGRKIKPLMTLFHNSKVDPLLPAAPEFLGCVARTISLAIKLETVTTSVPRRKHCLYLQETMQSSDEELSLVHAVPTHSDYNTVRLTLDQPYLESDLKNSPWVLLPVYLEGPLRTLHRQQKFMGNGPVSDKHRLTCHGLFLLRSANGDLLRKGVFACTGDEWNPNLYRLFDAMKRARPNFVIIV